MMNFRDFWSFHLLLVVFLNGNLAAPPSETNDPNLQTFEFVMPNITQPTYETTYLCISQKMDPDTSTYLLSFSPKINTEIIHHVGIFGCNAPGSTAPVWDCSHLKDHEPNLPLGDICTHGEQFRLIFPWEQLTPAYFLPKGIGFRVGGNTREQYLVLQVHYKAKFPEGTIDSSGLIIETTTTPQSKTAGILITTTGEVIPPHSVITADLGCEMTEDLAIHPIGFQPHTHGLGIKVEGYAVKRDEDGVDHWTLLGEQNPQLPQAVYPVVNYVTLVKGDFLATRCTYVSNRNVTTNNGETYADEMCNFYVLYWVDGPDNLKNGYCSSIGTPFYSWNASLLARLGPRFNNIPEDVSNAIDDEDEEDTKQLSYLMPGIHNLTYETTYLCTSLKLDPDNSIYLTAFHPQVNGKIIHHINVFACTEPAVTDQPVWDCSHLSYNEPQFVHAGVCKGRERFRMIFPWEQETPAFQLPEGVSFRVGGDSSEMYLVMQVHYTSFPEGTVDSSGIIIDYQTTPTPRSAGMIITTVGETILPNSTISADLACELLDDMEVHPIGYQPHTHGLGTCVAGYVVKLNPDGVNYDWTLLGKKNPQWAQAVYPVDNNVTMVKGDYLAVRCTYTSHRNTTTRNGETYLDEMCNYYTLYWVEGPNKLQKTIFCNSYGPLYYSWENGGLQTTATDADHSNVYGPQLNNVPANSTVVEASDGNYPVVSKATE